MTVSAGTGKVQYTGNGVSTVFTLSEKVLASTEIVVKRRVISTGVESTVPGSEYTVVVAVDFSSATVTFGTAPTSDHKITILRILPYIQTNDYITNDGFPANAHETAMDRLVMITQQLQRDLDTKLGFSDSESSAVSLDLPAPAAGQLLAWNEDEDALENVQAVDVSLITIPALAGNANKLIRVNSAGTALEYTTAVASSLEDAFDVGQSITIANTENRTLLITNNDTTNNPVTTKIVNATTGNGLFIDQNGNGVALYIDSEATTQPVVDLEANTVTTAYVINVDNLNAVTDGGAISIISNASSGAARSLVRIENQHTSSNAAVCLEIVQSSGGNAIKITTSGDSNAALTITASAQEGSSVVFITAPVMQTGQALNVSNMNGLTSGNAVRIESGSTTLTGNLLLVIHTADNGANTGCLVKIVNDIGNSTGMVPLYIDQDAVGEAILLDVVATAPFFNFVGTIAAATTASISSLATSGATTHHIQAQLNGTKVWIPCSTNNPS